MARPMPHLVAEFLKGRRIAVAGVSHNRTAAANAIFKKLQDSGYTAVPINPTLLSYEGVQCYPDLKSVPGDVDGLIFAAHPRVAVDLVRQCKEKGVPRIWFHRSFGQGSVSEAAIRECKDLWITSIVGGCPLMYLSPDVGHRCVRWWLSLRGRVPA